MSDGVSLARANAALAIATANYSTISEVYQLIAQLRTAGAFYLTNADGLADTAEGEAFIVITSDQRVQIIQKVSGAAVVKAEFATIGNAPILSWFAPNTQRYTLATTFEAQRSTIAGDGSGDDTTEFAAWETAAATYATGATLNIQTPQLVLGPRAYALGSISKKSFGWVGQGADNTKLLFNGTAAADFITQDTVTGRNSAAILRDMTIDGNNCGSIYKIPQNVSNYGCDDRLQIENVRFMRGTKQLNLDSWVNAHFSRLRFDNWGDTAIYLKPKATQVGTSFHLSNFTCDNSSGGSTTATATSFCKLDLSLVSTSGNIGVVKFSDARIEFNNYALTGNKTVFDIVTTTGSARQAEIVLDSIVLQNNVSGGVDHLFYRAAAGSAQGERYCLRDVQMSGITDIFGGDYPTWMKAIPAGNWMLLVGDTVNGFVGLRTVSGGATGFEFFGPSSSTIIRSVKVPGESYDRVQERPDALLSGTGAAAPTITVRYSGSTGWSAPAAAGSKSALPSYSLTGNADQSQITALTNLCNALVTALYNGASGAHGLLKP